MKEKLKIIIPLIITIMIAIRIMHYINEKQYNKRSKH